MELGVGTSQVVSELKNAFLVFKLVSLFEIHVVNLRSILVIAEGDSCSREISGIQDHVYDRLLISKLRVLTKTVQHP